MNYVPKPDQEGINVEGRESLFWNFAILSAAFVAIVIVIFFSLSFIGEQIALRLDIQSEIKWLKPLSQVALQNPWPKGSEILAKLIPLNEASLYQVAYLCEETPNAFALPGRKILVTSGLIRRMTNENSMAFVLAHELGHFIQKDHLRQWGRSLAITLGMSLIGLGETQLLSMDKLSDIVTRAQGRSDEAGADKIGSDLVIKAYGGLQGSQDFFESLLKESQKNSLLGWKEISLLNTHPGTQERLVLLQRQDQATVIPFDATEEKLNCPH